MPFIISADTFDLSGKTIIIVSDTYVDLTCGSTCYPLHLTALIQPVVSTANIGQLAIDLITATLSLQRIAVLDSRFCVPVVGGREDGGKGITTPLELYCRPDLDFVVLQQRSPVLKALKQEFIDTLFEFIKESKFGSVLFLSGVDLSERTDSQMMTPTYQLIPKNSVPLDSTALRGLKNLPIPVYVSPVQQHPQEAKNPPSIPFIPGGGLTRRILSTIPEGWKIPTACLLQFVLEGDNRADAAFFASVVVKVIGQEVAQWKQPGSWRDGLFGTPHDQTLYG